MLLVAAVLVGVGLGLAGTALLRTRAVLQAQLSGDARVRHVVMDPDAKPAFVYRLVEPLMNVAASVVRHLSPAGRTELLYRRLVYAGLEGRVSIERLLALKALGAVVGVGLGWLAGSGRMLLLLVVLFAAVGFFVPDIVLGSMADRRQRRIGHDVGEALDLVAITVEAGLGLEQALQIVSEHVPGPFAEELTRLLREMELGVSRRDSLAALRERTNIPELSGFVVALIQADVMGASIAEVLRVQAGQVRMRRRQRAREQAAKTPVKILFPVIFGILPALMVVTLGPGILSIAHAFFHHG